MSLYGEYLKERLGDFIVEMEHGFGSYRFPNFETVYIVDIYVQPEFRKHGIARDIADMITECALAKGCTKMIGSVVPSTKGSTESVKTLLAYGMTLDSCGVDFILFKKEIR